LSDGQPVNWNSRGNTVRLSHGLIQTAMFGEAYVPTEVAFSVKEAREQILVYQKTACVRGLYVSVILPDDGESFMGHVQPFPFIILTPHQENLVTHI